MILIVGCGYLGSYLLREITEKSEESVIVTVRDFKKSNIIPSTEYVYCDVTDEESVKKLADMCSDEELTVFYLASCHNVDYVFKNPEEAERINVRSLEAFIEKLQNIKKLFYASTDCVYGESVSLSDKFSEESDLHPINEYGRQKIEAEKIVLSKGYTVVRLPFLLGPSLLKKTHFYDSVYSALAKGEKIDLIDGMYRSTISFSQAANFIYSLALLENVPPIINVCADNALSKYDIGCILAKKMGVSEDIIKKISEVEGKRFFKDKRASHIYMDNSLLKELLGIERIQWEEEICL